MIKVTIIGHSESRYYKQSILRQVDDTIVILKRDHNENLLINTNGAPGVSHFVLDAALKYDIKYKIYLPHHYADFSKYWKKTQQKKIKEYVNNRLCSGMYISDGLEGNAIRGRNQQMINESNLVFAFWVGKKQGETYFCIKHAMKNNLQVFNVYNENVKKLQKKDLR